MNKNKEQIKNELIELRTHVNHCGITKGDFFLREFERETLHMVSQLVTEYLEDNYSIIEVDEEVLDMVNFVQSLEKYTTETRRALEDTRGGQ